MQFFSIRMTFLTGFVVSVLLLAFAGYLQFVGHVMPCPLCQVQRFMVGMMSLLFLLAAIHNPSPSGVKVYSSLVILCGLMGVWLAARQVWLQVYASVDAANCGVGFYYLLNVLPLSEALKMAFLGTGDCAHVTWQFLGISLPGWTLVFFVLFVWVGVYQIWRVRKVKRVVAK